jgi:head-tail adaptor
MTQIRELRNRVVLLRRRIVEEIDGSFKEYWEETDAVWAKIIPYLNKEVLGEGWNKISPTQAKYKITIRSRRRGFSRMKWDDLTLALLCPPVRDPYRQWITCFMYELGEDNE